MGDNKVNELCFQLVLAVNELQFKTCDMTVRYEGKKINLRFNSKTFKILLYENK